MQYLTFVIIKSSSNHKGARHLPTNLISLTKPRMFWKNLFSGDGSVVKALQDSKSQRHWEQYQNLRRQSNSAVLFKILYCINTHPSFKFDKSLEHLIYMKTTYFLNAYNVFFFLFCKEK